MVAEDVRRIASRRVVERLIRYCDDAQAISGHIQTISWSIESFTVSTLCQVILSMIDTVWRWV